MLEEVVELLANHEHWHDPRLDPEAVGLVVPPLLRAMQWLGLDADIAATIGEVLRRFTLDELPAPVRFVVAGVLDSTDDRRGTAIIDAVIETNDVLPTRLANVRAIAAGASYADRDHGFAIHRKLFPLYLGVTDWHQQPLLPLGVAVHRVARVGICDLELANLLGSGFAF